MEKSWPTDEPDVSSHAVMEAPGLSSHRDSRAGRGHEFVRLCVEFGSEGRSHLVLHAAPLGRGADGGQRRRGVSE
jgi:hypothetical protein